LYRFHISPLSFEHVEILADYLRHNTALKELALRNVQIDNRGTATLVKGLSEGLSQVEKLNLSDNSITDMGISTLSLLLDSKPFLKSLTLVRTKCGAEGFKTFTSALALNQGLEEVRLSLPRQGIDKQSLENFGTMFTKNQTLKLLWFEDGKLMHIHSLAIGLANSQSLKTLGLVSVHIDDESVRVLMELLNGNCVLKELNLSWNHISDLGASYLAEHLKRQNQCLASLDLTQNSIGDQGAEMISTALRMNSTLKFLSLASNRIGATGANALARSLQENKSLQTLKLMKSSLEKDSWGAFLEALRSNHTLLDLDYSNRSKYAYEIHDALEYNKVIVASQSRLQHLHTMEVVRAISLQFQLPCTAPKISTGTSASKRKAAPKVDAKLSLDGTSRTSDILHEKSLTHAKIQAEISLIEKLLDGFTSPMLAPYLLSL